MSDEIFDFKELEQYEKQILDMANNKMPKNCRKFVNGEGTKLRKATLSRAKATVKKKTGRYYKSIKKGKAYIYSGNGGYAVRVYASPKIAPHAHLIEDGHRTRGDGGKEQFVPGLKVFDNSERQFQNTFYNDVEKFIDDVIGKGLS